MFRIRARRCAKALFVATLFLIPGCTDAIVGDAARSSLATFLTTVFSQSVNTAIIR